MNRRLGVTALVIEVSAPSHFVHPSSGLPLCVEFLSYSRCLSLPYNISTWTRCLAYCTSSTYSSLVYDCYCRIELRLLWRWRSRRCWQRLLSLFAFRMHAQQPPPFIQPLGLILTSAFPLFSITSCYTLPKQIKAKQNLLPYQPLTITHYEYEKLLLDC